MTDLSFHPADEYVLNYATKYLARFNTDRRHSYGGVGVEAPRDNIAEAWRFPVIDTYGGGVVSVTAVADFDNYNTVTFVYAGADRKSPASVGVIGTFATLYEPLALRQVLWEGEPTRFWALSFAVPKGQKHRYRFIIDSAFPINDPINPQEQVEDNGAVWSAFFTDAYSSPVVMDRWELDILYRLSTEILPFQTEGASNFLNRFYDHLDQASQDSRYAHVYRMDTSVGEVNFIDNILAREERCRITRSACTSSIACYDDAIRTPSRAKSAGTSTSRSTMTWRPTRWPAGTTRPTRARNISSTCCAGTW